MVLPGQEVGVNRWNQDSGMTESAAGRAVRSVGGKIKRRPAQRTLPGEEDLARSLLSVLTSAERGIAIADDTAPADIYPQDAHDRML